MLARLANGRVVNATPKDVDYARAEVLFENGYIGDEGLLVERACLERIAEEQGSRPVSYVEEL